METIEIIFKFLISFILIFLVLTLIKQGYFIAGISYLIITISFIYIFLKKSKKVNLFFSLVDAYFFASFFKLFFKELFL